MKKILIIYWIIISAWIYLAFTAITANAEQPSFFVAEEMKETKLNCREVPEVTKNKDKNFFLNLR